MNEGDQVYLVRYALTEGLLAGKAVKTASQSADHIYADLQGRCFWGRIGRDIFADPADAIAAAEVMRDRKIKSLERQLAKLRAMTFSIPEGGDDAR